MTHDPLIRPYFLGCVGGIGGGVPLDSHDGNARMLLHSSLPMVGDLF